MLKHSFRFLAPMMLAALSAWGPSAVRAADVEPFKPAIATMDVSELRPGMKGYGLTVYSGTKVERFGVEIKGVFKGAFADGDMIIVELDHPILKDIGVVAGMSGSPVFIDDKLVGAVAYGWGFSVRPVGGVTPIKEMLKVYSQITTEAKVNPDDRANLEFWPEARAALQSAMPSQKPFSIPNEKMVAWGFLPPDQRSGASEFLPLGTPVTVSSSSRRVMGYLEQEWAGTGLQPVMAAGGAGPSAALDPNADVKVENGGAIAVVMVEGDLALAGTGTTTYVEGDKVIAFGHPMFGEGAVDAPIAVSEIITVIPTVARPFKLGNPVREVGALRQDRLPAIGATLSARAEMIPLKVRISAAENGVDKDFNFKLWNSREMLGMLSFICFLESLDKAVRSGGQMGVELTYTLNLADGRRLKKTQFASDTFGAPFFTGFDMRGDVDFLLNNRFEPVKISNINVEAKITPRLSMLLLEKMVRGETTLKPGETFKGQLEFARWRQPNMTVPFEFALPKTLRPGRYDVRIMDGTQRASLEGELRPELRKIDSVDDALRAAAVNFPSNRLHIVLLDTQEQVVMDGMKLSNLPRSVAQATNSTVRSSAQMTTARARLLQEKTIAYDAMVLGSAGISLEVVSPR